MKPHMINDAGDYCNRYCLDERTTTVELREGGMKERTPTSSSLVAASAVFDFVWWKWLRFWLRTASFGEYLGIYNVW